MAPKEEEKEDQINLTFLTYVTRNRRKYSITNIVDLL